MPFEVPDSLFDVLTQMAEDNQEPRTELIRRLLLANKEVKARIKAAGVTIDLPDRNPAADLHAEVMKLYSQNMSQADIARRVNRSPSWILRIIRKEQRKESNA